MIVLQRTLVDPPQALTPAQQLACAVLAQAILDARPDTALIGIHNERPGAAVVARAQAATWLRESAGFHFWCQVAGVDPQVIRARLGASHAKPDDRSRLLASRRRETVELARGSLRRDRERASESSVRFLEPP